MALNQYLNQAFDALDSQDSDRIAALLKLADYYKGTSGNKALENAVKRMDDIDTACSDKLASPADEIFANRLKCMVALCAQQYAEAYVHQSNVVSSYLKAFQNDTNWSLSVLYAVDYDLRQIAKLADKELLQQGKKPTLLEDAARVLNRCFTVTITDRAPLDQSKKMGALHIINSLFGIYFQLNNLGLCKNLIRPVEGVGFPPFHLFPIAETVTYKFYIGRLAMFDGNYKKAQEELSFAFTKCPKSSKKNKRLILLYLTPVELLLGRFPTEYVLQKYSLSQFVDLMISVQQGNLRGFLDSLAAHQDFFIKRGIYLILEKLKTLTYRNLFKKIWLIQQKQTKLPLDLFVTAVEWQRIPMDRDEMESILANLIYEGYIKGYLSHQAGRVVVSSSNAFPPVPIKE